MIHAESDIKKYTIHFLSLIKFFNCFMIYRLEDLEAHIATKQWSGLRLKLNSSLGMLQFFSGFSNNTFTTDSTLLSLKICSSCDCFSSEQLKKVFRRLKLPFPGGLPKALKKLLKRCLHLMGAVRPRFGTIQKTFDEGKKNAFEAVKLL